MPLIVVSASGGARMQEGTLALMQLAKTLGALERLRVAGVPFISVLSDPTTGGVFASFAAVGDVNVAEPDALIGFAGSRVSAGTIAQELPPGFQRSEFLFSHGFIDRVVARPDLRDELIGLLRLLPVRVDDPAAVRAAIDTDAAGFRPLSFLSSLAERVAERTAGDGAATEATAGRAADRRSARRRLGARPARPQPAPAADARVHRGDDRRVRRAPRRPPVRRRRGDGRRARPDRRPAGRHRRPAEGRRHRREHPPQLRDAPSRRAIARRCGSWSWPSAFGLPVITFVDVPGAHPGPESEERGIAEAIARSIGLMSRLRTPIVTVITGEGGSGGALAIAVGDVVIALENAVYSVISPEGCAAILWRTADEAPAAALAMKMTAADQQTLGVVDIVVPEPGEGAHVDPAETARRLRPIILDRLAALEGLTDRRAARHALPPLPCPRVLH